MCEVRIIRTERLVSAVCSCGFRQTASSVNTLMYDVREHLKGRTIVGTINGPLSNK